MSHEGQGTIRDFPAFSPNADAEALHKAMKGLGCNDAVVTGVLCARSNAQRQQIAVAYKTLYGKDLSDSLKNELKGDFEDVILALMEPPARYDAKHLREAMKVANYLYPVCNSLFNSQLYILLTGKHCSRANARFKIAPML